MSLLGFLRNTQHNRIQGDNATKGNDEQTRLWNWAIHEDSLMTTRVSVFLLAESILIAVTATVVNTFAGLHSAKNLLRIEIFGLAIALILAGVALTLIFWYILNLNYQGLKILMAQLKALDPMYLQLDKKRKEDRNANRYFRTVFRHKGANDTINNLLPFTILIIWCVIAIFAIAIFVTH